MAMVSVNESCQKTSQLLLSRQNKTESNIERKIKIKYNKTTVYSGPWVMILYITA